MSDASGTFGKVGIISMIQDQHGLLLTLLESVPIGSGGKPDGSVLSYQCKVS